MIFYEIVRENIYVHYLVTFVLVFFFLQSTKTVYHDGKIPLLELLTIGVQIFVL